MLDFCLFDNLAYHSHSKKQTKQIPTFGVYDTSVKCAWRYSYPQHTTESIYNTPWQLLSFCFRLLFDCGSSNIQKQSVSNAFNYVVLWHSMCYNAAKIEKKDKEKLSRSIKHATDQSKVFRDAAVVAPLDFESKKVAGSLTHIEAESFK